MQLKISLKYSLLIVSLAGIISSSLMLAFFTFSSSVQGYYAEPSLTNKDLQNLIVNKAVEKPSVSDDLPAQTKSGLPVRLRIPKIKVNALIKNVGLTATGAMDKPKTPGEVVWFEPGTIPGDSGSAVLAGHYGRWKNGKGSVFDNLNKLKKGDFIYVEDANGLINTFVVREFKVYDKNAKAAEVFISSDGKSHLNLITCGGVWSNFFQSYSKRLVIFADKKE